jgi:hypothetical protein
LKGRKSLFRGFDTHYENLSSERARLWQ